MEKFESQFSDLDVQTSYMEETMSNTTAVSTPQDEVDALMKQTAEEANIELQHDLASRDATTVPDLTQKEVIGEEDDKLAAQQHASATADNAPPSRLHHLARIPAIDVHHHLVPHRAHHASKSAIHCSAELPHS